MYLIDYSIFLILPWIQKWWENKCSYKPKITSSWQVVLLNFFLKIKTDCYHEAYKKIKITIKKFQKYLNKNSPKTGYRLHSKFKWEAKSPA